MTDPIRHGENAGYMAGCHEECCRRAHARIHKLRKLRIAEGRWAPFRPIRAAQDLVQQLLDASRLDPHHMPKGWVLAEVVAKALEETAAAIEQAQLGVHRGFLPSLERGIVAGYEQAARIAREYGARRD